MQIRLLYYSQCHQKWQRNIMKNELQPTLLVSPSTAEYSNLLSDLYEIKLRKALADEYGFAYVGEFSPEGIAIANFDNFGGKGGFYIDRNGQTLPFKTYDMVHPFQEGYAVAEIHKFKNGDEHRGTYQLDRRLINSAGEDRLPTNWTVESGFKNGLAIVRDNSIDWHDAGTFFINHEGKPVTRPYFGLRHFSEGLAVAEVSYSYPGPTDENYQDYIYINSMDKKVLPTDRSSYWHAAGFSEELAVVGDHRHSNYFIDRSGTKMTSSFTDAWDFQESFACVNSGTWSRDYYDLCPDQPEWYFINREAENPFNAWYDHLTSFSEGIAFAAKDRATYLLDISGNRMAVSKDIDQMVPFSEGLMIIKRKEKYHYLDHNFSLAIDRAFESADSFHHGLAEVCDGSSEMIIDKSGLEIFHQPNLQK